MIAVFQGQDLIKPILKKRRHDMRKSTITAKRNGNSILKSILHNLSNSVIHAEFTRQDIEKLAAKTIISMDKMLRGREFDEYRFINATDLCVLMKDMGMIEEAGKVKKGWPEPSGGAAAQAIDYGICQVAKKTNPEAEEQTYRLH
jgi:hypothetical protein